jgi:tRNA-2-methylthio-N6-dimethylallyladenosine synthase
MEGCSKYCTFCVVPYTRGEEISRPFDDVIPRWQAWRTKACARSICSGRTSTPTAADARRRLVRPGRADPLRGRHTDGIERIRFTTSHPVEFSDALIEAYAEVPGARQFSAPAGAERLGPHAGGMMKRGHTALEYKDKIRRLRAGAAGYLPVVGLHRRLPGRDGGGL